MTMSKLLGRAAATAITLALTAGAGLSQELREITFAQPSASAINSFPVYVAIGEGYFAEEGLEVQVETVNGSGSVLQALAAGQADFGRPGPGPLLTARARGVDAVFIYNVAARANFGLMVEEDSPYQTPEDLAGKVVGTGTADGAEVGFARNVLSSAGMSPGEDYELLTVGDGGPATAAFLRDEIAAYSASVADAAVLGQRGVALRDITPAEFARFFGNGLVTMGDTIRDEPELVEKFVRAFMKGQKFAMDEANREASLDHFAAGFPQEIEDRDFASALFTAVRSKSVPLETDKGLGYLPPAVWEEWQASLIANGDLPAPLDDLDAAFTNDFVTKISAELE
ncbi:ABC transporter substrate-binding protein (plasmid) [Limimaricola variabilis]|uniref:ABC transporter substrate-binding protein n=1 Tax=Limimaricola variabilis TaxID=1492771 RepID=UPI002AC96C79|nr:ABC transporter substrate-binding protein [Limimaricola variabilis]WPY96757.1 ABC transporter substrate-binding protein [Limimaricola variabilis]